MKNIRKTLSFILSLMLVIGTFSAAVAPTAAAIRNPYSEAAMALDKEYAYDGELGAVYTPEQTVFKVWAPLAEDVVLNRYATGSDAEIGAADLGKVPMEKLFDGDRWTGVWTACVYGDVKNTYYTYSITNPTHICYPEDEPVETGAGDGSGSSDDGFVTHETQDIYSYAVGVNGDRSMVVDLDATDPDGWDNDSHVFTDHQTDAIVWEVHVKDFSWNPNSGVSESNRGKYLAFTETGTTLDNEGYLSTCVDYLKQLGITHVQINPFYDFGSVDETASDSQFNWGYDPKNYGVPEGSYSSNPYDGNVRINECKQMIQALHDAGIGVIMDVVYNHTYSTESCFNYSVPEYYYRIDKDGSYSAQSGCGNDTASERAMYRKYMRDMLRYWTNEYHIDGYRFDLMGIHDGETMNLIRDDMDEIDSRIIMFGEGWGGDTVYDPVTCEGTETYLCVQSSANKGISERIGFFNDQIRDGIKGKVFEDKSVPGFVNGELTLGRNISYGVAANTFGHGNWTAISPEQCVTYASCHDNLTLYDKLVCADHRTTRDFRARYADVIHANKLAAAILSSCQGIDFILAGEEMGRSKDCNDNSYNSPASLNMIDWSLIKTNADLVSYYKGMFELRKAFSPFTAYLTDAQDDSYKYMRTTNVTASVSTIGYTVENDTEGEWKKVAVIYSGKTTDVSFTLSKKADPSLTDDMQWVIVANDKSAGVTALGECAGCTFDVPAQSVVIAVDKESFEEAAIASRFSRLEVNSVYEPTGEVISSSVILGEEGEGYVVSPDPSIPIQYEYDSTEGEENGVFGSSTSSVIYKYVDFVPDSLTEERGDVDDDGNISILDATAIQRHLANIIHLDAEHEARGDYDYSKDTSILDVTLLQRYLAGLPVNVCKVTSYHIGVRNDVEKEITKPVDAYFRLGYEYKTDSATVAYYKLDETPENETGIATGSIKVTYHYTYSVDTATVHVIHDGSLTWEPSLWGWSYQGTTPINAYDNFPGFRMTEKNESGWYTTQFPVPGGLDYYFIISEAGGKKTMDYGPIDYEEYPEIWIVIHDSLYGKTGDWVSYYNYDPLAT